MNVLDYIKISLNNLSKRKLRTLITSLAISIGVMLMITLLSISNSFESFLINSLNDYNDINNITIENKAYLSDEEIESKLSSSSNSEVLKDDLFQYKKIDESVLNKLKENNDIEDMLTKYEDEVSEVLYLDKMVRNKEISYYDDKFYLDNEMDSLVEKQKENNLLLNPVKYILCGRNLSDADKNSVMISEDFVRNTLNIDNPNEVLNTELILKTIKYTEEKKEVLELKLNIVGVIDQRFYEPSIVVSKDVMTEVKNFNNSEDISLDERGVDLVLVSAKNVKNIENISDFIKYDLKFKYSSLENISKAIENAFKYFKAFLFIVGIIVTIIASLGVINTMLMITMEKNKSIGIMKATGASRKIIRNIFIIESSILGILGSILGVIFSFLNINLFSEISQSVALNYLNINKTNMINLKEAISIDCSVIIMVIIFAIILSSLSGLPPSIKASKLDAIDSLKFE